MESAKRGGRGGGFGSGDAGRLACAERDRVVEAAATDCFEALRRVRRHLHAEGLIPFCRGASPDVRPSGMARDMTRDMARGLRAPRPKPGRGAGIADPVDIFAARPDIVPASVEHQEACDREWLATPRA